MSSPRRPTFPAFPREERDPGFPVIASLAPLAAAGVIFAITRSPYALLFAVAAPVAALGGVIDRRIRRRRSERRTTALALERLAALRAEISSAHDEERTASVRGLHDVSRLATGSPAGLWRDAPVRVLIGSADVPSHLDLARPEDTPAPLRQEVERIATEAATVVDAGVVVDAAAIGVVGPSPVREAVVRSLALQLCASLPPATTAIRAPASESWAEGLPHRVTLVADARGFEFSDRGSVRRVVGADREGSLPPALDATVRVAGSRGAEVALAGAPEPCRDLRLGMTSRGFAELVASRLRDAAVERDGPAVIPDRVELGLLSGLERPGGLPAPIGVDGAGPVWVDLVADGPHAVVGGTTGSGKSETLVAWILAMSERRTPAEVSFLLVDFKGGSSFTRLEGLPHVVGVVSDLDASTARRATASLKSEVLRRERLLADAGVRDLGDLRGTPRLVIVVDEYAALVAEQPELHETIADLASRGRSLGLHLILCTQRPGGVIREQVLANAGLRICLRVNNRADSVAVLGTGDASELQGQPPGRALVLGESGEVRSVQCAIAASGDVERIVAATSGHPAPFRPWAEPLPTFLGAADLAGVSDGVAFGIVDLPEQQATAPATYVPARDGNLLCVGGRGSGTSTALATIARGLGERAVLAPSGLPDAWGMLTSVLEDGALGDGRVVVIDDVDLLLDAADEELRPGLVRLITALGRELPVRGGALVLGASRPLTAAASIVARVDVRLLLALPDREQHVLAGGERGDWVPGRPPGRGWWHGREVQVASAPRIAHPVPWEVPVLRPHPPVAVVAVDPDAVERRLAAAGLVAASPGEPPGDGRLLIGDPDHWMASWAALEDARRGEVLLVGCSASDLRSLFRIRIDPPPLDPRGSEGWLVEGRRVTRVRVAWPG